MSFKVVRKNGDVVCFGPNDDNYEPNVREGEVLTIEAEAPAFEVLSVPTVVTMRQARLALLQVGLLSQVNTAVANMPGAAGDTARIEWEFSSAVERNRPLVQSLIGALGLTESQLDDLFRLAATL